MPVAPIVCVRAGMGLGKSESVKDLLQEHCAEGEDETRVLMVTFSCALADKAHHDFCDLGFINYQDEQGAENRLLDQTRIIVCLDSLFRVVTKNFDFVIIDEACSVMLHYNSPLMKQSCANALKLELLINEAAHVYFVDAMLDTTFMKNVIDFFCMTKSVQAVWVCNKYVRPSNRKVHLVTDTGGPSASRTSRLSCPQGPRPAEPGAACRLLFQYQEIHRGPRSLHHAPASGDAHPGAQQRQQQQEAPRNQC
jgi:hypothetical protein